MMERWPTSFKVCETFVTYKCASDFSMVTDDSIFSRDSGSAWSRWTRL
jgi:hypothetical protein